MRWHPAGLIDSRAAAADAPEPGGNAHGNLRFARGGARVTLTTEDPSVAGPAGSTRWHRRPASRAVGHGLNLVFVLMGVFFVLSGYNTWAAVQPVAGGATTNGTVVSVQDGETCGRYGCSPNWTPTIRFEAGGHLYTFTGPTSGSQINVDDSVTVSYLPSNPSVAHDLSASDGQGLLLLGFGVFAVIAGLGSFLLGFGALHRRLGLSSARPGDGWVGHKYVHSNEGTLIAVAVVVALTVVGFFVI